MGSQLRPRSAYNSNNFSGLSSVQWFTKLLPEVVLSYLMCMLYLKTLLLVKHRRGSSNCAARRLLQAIYPMMGSLYSFMELYTKALVYRVFLRGQKMFSSQNFTIFQYIEKVPGTRPQSYTSYCNPQIIMRLRWHLSL